MLPLRAAGPEPARWLKAERPREFHFPADHGMHPGFRLEWWYWTGNVRTADDRAFGFQLTFFRTGLLPGSPRRASAWAARDLFAAHLAITDVRAQAFWYAQRSARDRLGMAGAATDRLDVWLTDWSAWEHAGMVYLRAADAGKGIELTLKPLKPPTLHGTGGLSRKGADPENASYYYSVSRSEARGVIQLQGERFQVRGLAWMDHEFSSNYLGSSNRGWDWFGLHLDDESDVMLFRMRGPAGGTNFLAGTYIDRKGKSTSIPAEWIALAPDARRSRAASGARYPTRWKLTIHPARGGSVPSTVPIIVLTVASPVPDQELVTTSSTGVTYWEGAVELSGIANGSAVRGKGYLELVGYASSVQGRF